ncbi:hypothetical protein NDU88_001788 [Pleurodeles waltl]|uniref:Uncharacterized protein n=1 Tax=Pleurodeles waltl TaxID=8319 RepID=A0AAV7KSV3_PLEWA|nr:hypothetical protein NDU88_001788 [Pleurodeles waltl]
MILIKNVNYRSLTPAGERDSGDCWRSLGRLGHAPGLVVRPERRTRRAARAQDGGWAHRSTRLSVAKTSRDVVGGGPQLRRLLSRDSGPSGRREKRLGQSGPERGSDPRRWERPWGAQPAGGHQTGSEAAECVAQAG